MNNFFVTTIAFIFLANLSYAQPYYLKVGGAVGIEGRKNSVVMPGPDYEIRPALSTECGYYIYQAVQVNFGFQYLIKTGFSIPNLIFWQDETGDTIVEEGTTKFSSQMLCFTPGLTISPFSTGIFTPYVQAAFIIGIGRINAKDIGGDSGTIISRKLTGGFAKGLFASIGTDIRLTGRWNLFAQIKGSLLEYTPKEMSNPTPFFPSLKPYAFNSIALNLGLKYSFGKKKQEQP